ncbi:RNA methyltransferase [Candidatus Micrarchaeota archaeon]|nr:RNA methyltransferase [Candidatus Micrarchaeota archaeon]
MVLEKVKIPMIRIVLVEPLYPVNLGSVARVMANFGCTQLYLVRPKVIANAEAIKYAKHARSILKRARTVEHLEEALHGMDWVVATTGVPARYRRKLKNCWTPKEFADHRTKKERIALVFGSEGTGLSKSDFDACDGVVSIPTNRRYRVLNLSHAVAVMLYELSCGRGMRTYYKTAPRHKIRFLEGLFDEITCAMPSVRDKQKVASAFRQVIRRSRVADDEIQSLFAVFGSVRKRVSPLRHKRNTMVCAMNLLPEWSPKPTKKKK